ncbi:helix-turn-helix transcriptional regulator [Nocardiopsis sp. RSe5-2]|uniref:Helix-turn-helix transcriptional regulator n=1 Tax=Nocardiopsis endophytica TaxID=3018445 RepID=A0ABT4U7R1_9ACTN|nr:helix-turn-helix transcriptional regulator [Nocardiopsis endophytica]MDA2812996.1 helix-turn-helix transcriptional regulator [Nocardiopsis endophytica]
MRAEVLRGHLDGLLLAVLADGPLHGYDVVDRLRRHSGGEIDLASGTVYPALHRLERGGLLDSRWSTGGGRRRRVYRLTPAGRSVLEEERDAWHRIASVVTRVLDGAAGRGSAPATLDT